MEEEGEGGGVEGTGGTGDDRGRVRGLETTTTGAVDTIAAASITATRGTGTGRGTGIEIGTERGERCVESTYIHTCMYTCTVPLVHGRSIVVRWQVLFYYS